MQKTLKQNLIKLLQQPKIKVEDINKGLTEFLKCVLDGVEERCTVIQDEDIVCDCGDVGECALCANGEEDSICSSCLRDMLPGDFPNYCLYCNESHSRCSCEQAAVCNICIDCQNAAEELREEGDDEYEDVCLDWQKSTETVCPDCGQCSLCDDCDEGNVCGECQNADIEEDLDEFAYGDFIQEVNFLQDDATVINVTTFSNGTLVVIVPADETRKPHRYFSPKG